MGLYDPAPQWKTGSASTRGDVRSDAPRVHKWGIFGAGLGLADLSPQLERQGARRASTLAAHVVSPNCQ